MKVKMLSALGSSLTPDQGLPMDLAGAQPQCRDITGRLTMQTCLDLPEDPII